MQRTIRHLAGFALAAATLAAATPALAQAQKATGYRILPTPEYAAKIGRTPDAAAATAGSVLYYGGSVFSNVKVVSVMWGASVNATIVSSVPGFSAALVNSSYIDQMSQYDTFLNAVDGRAGTNQHIGRGSYLGQVQITPKNTSNKLSDLAIQKELKYQIGKGALPKNDLNTLYMVYFPVTAKITVDGLHSCLQFGAYHSATITTGLDPANLFYSVEPDCHSSWSSITNAASHEFAEATTDNIPTPGSSPAFPQAWNNASGYEVGDLCSGTGQLSAAGKTYTVQQIYLNTTGACSTGNYTSP